MNEWQELVEKYGWVDQTPEEIIIAIRKMPPDRRSELETRILINSGFAMKTQSADEKERLLEIEKQIKNLAEKHGSRIDSIERAQMMILQGMENLRSSVMQQLTSVGTYLQQLQNDSRATRYWNAIITVLIAVLIVLVLVRP